MSYFLKLVAAHAAVTIHRQSRWLSRRGAPQRGHFRDGKELGGVLAAAIRV
jgi:hypothetical protein